jgi:hypothetical protein
MLGTKIFLGDPSQMNAIKCGCAFCDGAFHGVPVASIDEHLMLLDASHEYTAHRN